MGEWIPCSEKLPVYGDKCIVTQHDREYSKKKVSLSYCYVQKEGFWSDTPFGYEVIAWMPMPEAWKGEE